VSAKSRLGGDLAGLAVILALASCLVLVGARVVHGDCGMGADADQATSLNRSGGLRSGY
jgi:hypothetical protein